VGFVVIAEILQTLGDTRDAARIFGEGWGNLQALELVGWAWFSVPIMGSTSENSIAATLTKLIIIRTAVGCVGQLFFAWRIAIFGKSWYIPAVIAVVIQSLVLTKIRNAHTLGRSLSSNLEPVYGQEC
jgi:hypothetical protein